MSEKAKRYYWLKLPENWFRQKNVKRLRSIAGGDTYTIIYLKMMLRSLQSDGKLYFDGYENNFSDEIALDIDEDPNNVRVAVSFLINAGLLVLDNQTDAQAATLPECLKLTGSESSSAQRVRKFRARESAKSVTCNGDVTNCNTEIEIEKELEIEKDKTVCGELSHDSLPQPKPKKVRTAMAEASTEGDVFLKVPLNTGDLFPISLIWIEEQKSFYPGINVETVVRQAAGWLMNNPKNRKTRTGMSRFLSNWLNREQNRAVNPEQRYGSQYRKRGGFTDYAGMSSSHEYGEIADALLRKQQQNLHTTFQKEGET